MFNYKPLCWGKNLLRVWVNDVSPVGILFAQSSFSFICKWIALLQVTISLPWFLKKLRKFGAS